MALNLSPNVAEARDIAKKHDDDMVIVFRITPDLDIAYASYGRTEPLCVVAQQLGDGILDHMIEILEKVEHRLKNLQKPTEKRQWNRRIF